MSEFTIFNKVLSNDEITQLASLTPEEFNDLLI
jgi:hypothetical protein